jgi:hypothetical protein
MHDTHISNERARKMYNGLGGKNAKTRKSRIIILINIIITMGYNYSHGCHVGGI